MACSASVFLRAQYWHFAQLHPGEAVALGEFAAWVGLAPRQTGTGGRVAQLGISKRSDAYLRADYQQNEDNGTSSLKESKRTRV
ncbi:hypothetical protein RCH10_003513 [Variovorax sp. GrIS 2.14]